MSHYRAGRVLDNGSHRAIISEERLRDEAPVALDHEHGKAYDAVETAAQRLDLSGPAHAREAALLRAIRRRLHRHILEGSCDGD